jgi:hypothetical protein
MKKVIMFGEVSISMLILLSGLGCSRHQTANKAGIIEHGSTYDIRIKDQTLTIAPSVGGRITSLKLNGNNFLTGKKVHSIYWGSTFWPSPQSRWAGMLLPPVIDNKPYAVSMANNIITMTSQNNPKADFIIKKEFYGNKKKDYYSLKYTITNRSDSTQQVAPWEVTRVHAGGLAFFPMGKGELNGGLAPLVKQRDGIVWFTYQRNEIRNLKSNRKLYADGNGGWVAEVNGQAILIKTFPDISPEDFAPHESEVELYASPVKLNRSYVEMEIQGPYETLAPGDSLNWSVKWYLRRLPDSIKPKAINTSLVSYVKNLIRQ